MNPIDTNTNLRTSRSDTDSATRRSAQAASSGSASATADSGSTESAESISLTQAAADLLALENQLRALPTIDQARVAEIRQSIEDGSYSVDPQRIVDNLLESERDLT
ncbi:MAG: flagellar biosynthesis anti-sigma factor FlgM [Pseudomonadota bacterium]